MTYPVDLSPHFGRFILDFVSDPEGLLARGAETGITQTYTLEIAAWCAELNEQLKRIADEEGVQLQLMGGNAASLRLDASAQRSSRDNDYLTTATEAEVDALMGRLADRFADLPEPLLRPRRISAEGKMKLPLASYLISVPAIIVGNRETLEAKVEFHLETELPPSEDVTGRPFAIGKPLTTSIPALPYQIGLKLIMFDDPPVGVPPERIDVIPQQLHDIDSVAVKMTRPEDWSVLGGYVRRRYVKERRFQDLPVEDEAPWAGIARRLDDWARCDVDAAMWKLVQNFQSALLGRASRRSPGEWRARTRRLSVMARAAATDRTDLYLRALELEGTIDQALSGREARKPRAAIGNLMGPYWAEHKNKLNGYGLRTTYWEALAVSEDLERRLIELAALTTAQARTSR